MIKLIAFDWNGTLFADTTALVKGASKVLKLFGLRSITTREYQEHFDVPVKNLYVSLGISDSQFDENSELIAKTFHLFYEGKALRLRTRANTNKLLLWLTNKKIPSIIFSNHVEDKIKLQLKRLMLEKYFSAVLANNHIGSAYRGRLKEEKLKNYIKSNNLNPSEVLIIGDTIEEIEIGRSLGCKIIAITDGNCSTSRLKAAKPDFLINNLSEIPSIIEKLNK